MLPNFTPFLHKTAVEPNTLAYQILADGGTLLTIPVPPFASADQDLTDIDLIYKPKSNTKPSPECVEPFMFVLHFRSSRTFTV